jgi:hypothetical protein
MVLCDDKKKDRDIMAEAVLARKKIKEFALIHAFATLALSNAIFSWLAKGFFMSNSPRDTGNRNGKNEQPYYLQAQSHYDTGSASSV